MTQHDPEAWLDLTRQALAPREGDRARVLAALEQRLDLPSNDGAGELARNARNQAGELNSIQAASPSLPLGIPSTFVRWALGAIVPLAGVAAVSVMLTTRATPRVPVLKSLPQITATKAAVTEPSLLDLSLAQVKEVSEPKAPEPAPPAKEKKPQRKKCRTAQGNERPCTTIKASETAIASAPPPPAAAAPASSLSQELAALREAQRALREGRPAHALGVLTSFEQNASGPGAMQEERHAASTMARCALAQPGETTQLYQDFVQRYPNSAYAARLQRTCLPKTSR